jgi:hypothetical protein
MLTGQVFTFATGSNEPLVENLLAGQGRSENKSKAVSSRRELHLVRSGRRHWKRVKLTRIRRTLGGLQRARILLHNPMSSRLLTGDKIRLSKSKIPGNGS